MHIETLGGRGPELVMLHGWGMHGGIWRDIAERLAGDYRVRLVDLPGHGRSARAGDHDMRPSALATALSERLDRDAIWLGWSFGGLVALQAALDRPAQVAALCLLGATPRFVAGPGWPHAQPPEIFEDFAHELERDYHSALNRFLALEVHGSEHAREALRRLRRTALAHGPPAVAALREGLRELGRADVTPRLAELDRPTLWLGGRRDRLVPPAALAAAAARQPNAQSAVLPGAGHAPFISQPEAVLSHLDRFLKGARCRAAS